MVLAAAGAVDHEKLLEEAERRLGLARRRHGARALAGALSRRHRRARRSPSSRPIWCSPSRRRNIAMPTISPRKSAPACSVAACPRASSRRCASGAGSAMPSAPLPPASPTAACSRFMRLAGLTAPQSFSRGSRRAAPRRRSRLQRGRGRPGQGPAQDGAACGAGKRRRPRRAARPPNSDSRPAASHRRN